MDIVIGAAFGDEGKGLVTHHLASRYGRDAMVVRFNGGAQAGHTVVTQQGQRHVFRHVGSGTFAGASTFLSRFFVANPILYLDEIKALKRLAIKPNVYIDPDARVTTPYDMMINQITEELRGKQRHGSCGVGFAETIERNLYPAFSLKVADLENAKKVNDTLALIRRNWLPERLKALEVTTIPAHWQQLIDSEDIFQFYLHQLALFLESVTVSRIDLTTASPLIFEGAQGLMLDQECGWFPHVTRSHTGLKNVFALMEGKGNPSLNVVYVTRSYLTRHGAGPLPYELSNLPYEQVSDNTNVTNTYQGALRYAWFNLTLLSAFIQADMKAQPSHHPIHCQLAITCLDQVDDRITFIEHDKIVQASPGVFLQKVAQEIPVAELWCSYGPTRATLKKWQDK